MSDASDDKIKVILKFDGLDDLSTNMTFRQVENLYLRRRYDFEWDEDHEDYYWTYKIDDLQWVEEPGCGKPFNISSATLCMGRLL